ncbi:hypothetical protein DCAR_0625650 [Daucus carota subsp. sativus]|uniref:Uncharacterized protein n=1 Tax=Daucus carota subsp. sativus TaxID=79200 RepID=A0A164WL35_DAUCS|nr:hypothetical protein DCAR_0625650 [Daucus carota subsp. sativus]
MIQIDTRYIKRWTKSMFGVFNPVFGVNNVLLAICKLIGGNKIRTDYLDKR